MNWVLITFLAWIAAITAHAFALRIFPKANTIVLFCTTAFAAGLALLAYIADRDGTATHLIAAATLFAFCCELYIFIFTFVISSVSVWILVSRISSGRTIDASGTGKPTSSGMVAQRMSGLQGSGFVQLSHGSYSLTSRGRTVLWVYQQCRFFFGHDAVRVK
jgi:hypothetical protein